MSVITVIKKIGEKIISIVEWPIKHSVMLAEMFTDFVKDAPTVKTLCVGLVEQFEAVGPDVATAIAEHGLDIPDDLKTAGDVQSLFAYFTKTFLPGIESAYADFKTAADIVDPATGAAAPAANTATPETAANVPVTETVPE